MKFTVWALSCAFTAAVSAAPRAENALMFELNQKGFGLLSNELKKSLLKDVSNEALPNVNEEVDHGIKVQVDGMRYSIEFDSLSLVPNQGGIDVDLAVKKVHLEADSMHFEKKILITISATCRNTSLDVGEGGPVHLTGRLIPTVQGRRIAIRPESINFGIADNNFKINGPSECSGALGVGHLVKWVVGKILNNSKGKLEETVRAKVADMIPTLENRLNDQVMRTFPLAFQIPGFSEVSKIAFRTFPYAIDWPTNAMAFRLSVDVSEEDVSFRRDRSGLVLDGLPIGATGLNPALLNEAFAKVFPEGGPYVELTEKLVPNVGEILSVKTAQALWPDLKEQTLGADHLRAFVRFNAPPEFSVNTDEARVKVLIPDLQIRFQAHIGGDWRDYFIMSLKVATTAILDVESGNLSVKIAPDAVVSVSGTWPTGYAPKNPSFESELTEFLFSAIFEYLAGQGALTHVALPMVNLGGDQVGISKLDVVSPFIRAEVSTQ